VELTIPAWPEFLSLLRVTVAAVAARVDMTIDEIDDLQLATEELCLTLFGDGVADARLLTSLDVRQGTIEVACRLEGAAASLPREETVASALSRRILDALVDEHDVSDDGTVRIAWLRKRRRSAPD
jgi:serine/threonine-protein kinase RsbW